MQINEVLEKLPTSDSFDVLTYIGYYGIQRKKVLEAERQNPAVDHQTFYLYENYYKESLERILGREKLNNDWLFHGTGKYSYSTENKYYGNFTQVQSKLENIFYQGINPHPDNWLPNIAEVQTTSLTPAYMYSKWYAARHNTDVQALKYEFGNSFNWFMYYIYDTVKSGPRWMAQEKGSKSPFIDYAKESLKLLKRLKGTQTKRTDGMHNLQRWYRSLNAAGTDETELMEILTGNSDIQSNYGIVLGIHKSRVKPLDDISYFGLHEIRTEHAIKPQDISFAIAPFKYCEDVSEIAYQNGLEGLVVIPQECVEYHLTRFSISDHTDNLRTF